MAPPTTSLSFDTGFDPQTGQAVAVAPGIVRVSAPNRGPFTFTGTNSFILGTGTVAVVDPGPDDERHLDALRAAIGGRAVQAIVLTHTHQDHAALAPRLAAVTGAPLWFGAPPRGTDGERTALVPDRVLADGESLTLGGLPVEAVATPGHSADHFCFGLVGTPYLLSGDHVMGWSSTVMGKQDGALAAYFAALERLIALPYAVYLPAHGGPVADGPRYAAALRQHRQLRNEEIVRAVNAGARSIGAVLKAVYPKLSLPLVPAARLTLRAHVDYLAARGLLRATPGPFGMRLQPL